MLTSHILMIRPVSFGFNEQTAESNAFQQRNMGEQNIQQQALAEFNAFADTLCDNGLDVTIIDDTPDPHTPDSIFPNNWVSFHEDGGIFLYPMQAENRRFERRDDIIDSLKNKFLINTVKDLSHFENQEKFLEGTGSLVLDRENKLAYTCLSPRTDDSVLDEFCKQSGYTPILFHSVDQYGKAIYHTNVLMCMGDQFVVISLDAISDKEEKEVLLKSFAETNKQVIEISQQQLNNFAGNMLELVNNKGERLLIMSAKAEKSLTPGQINALQKYCRIVSSDIQTIETIGGGSTRCMIAEVFLPLKS